MGPGNGAASLGDRQKLCAALRKRRPGRGTDDGPVSREREMTVCLLLFFKNCDQIRITQNRPLVSTQPGHRAHPRRGVSTSTKIQAGRLTSWGSSGPPQSSAAVTLRKEVPHAGSVSTWPTVRGRANRPAESPPHAAGSAAGAKAHHSGSEKWCQVNPRDTARVALSQQPGRGDFRRGARGTPASSQDPGLHVSHRDTHQMELGLLSEPPR